jgi:lipid-binding SYLF domain-containing protein
MKFLIVAALALTPLMATNKDSLTRLNQSAAVFSEVMATPDKGIPQELLENAHCIVIVPGMKTAAFLVGGKYGKGYLSCRNKGGDGWSAPATMRIECGSIGFQIGGSQTDLMTMPAAAAEPARGISSLRRNHRRGPPALAIRRREVKPGRTMS